jgi:ketosteroid isomerase-like protein
MRKIIFSLALALPLLATAQAITQDSPAVMAPVHQFIDGFNKGDLKSAVAACADEASVIDDFPPHEWQGAGGCRKWADGFEALVKEEGITDAKIRLGKPRHVEVTDDRAYVVVAVTLDYKHQGKSKKLPSMFTASLHKETGGWRITGWAWADL